MNEVGLKSRVWDSILDDFIRAVNLPKVHLVSETTVQYKL